VNAQVTTEKSASILVFPKVIADGTRDTVIQITNTSNSLVNAHCFYVNGALDSTGTPLWQELDFDITLTKQQPTHWVVSEGRLVDPTDSSCTNGPPSNYSCNDAGIDPGRVPPVVEYFTGELKCIEVDDSGAPLSGNHLKGEATTILADHCVDDTCTLGQNSCTTDADCDDELYDVAKYNAIGVLGNENNNGDNVLCLGGQPTDECPFGAEYDACPSVWIANHLSEGAPDPFFGGDVDSAVDTTWTVVPCTQNFETQAPSTVGINILAYNEFEQVLSAGTSITCWDELHLDDTQRFGTVFLYGVRGSTFMQSRLTPTSASTASFMMVGTESHFAPSGNLSTADVNYHVEGARQTADIITIPPEQVQ
jgi:hypothetical protein